MTPEDIPTGTEREVLERIWREVRAQRILLQGDPASRDDGGLIGDVRDLKKSWGSFLWWVRIGGGAALTTGAGAVAARLLG